MTYWEKLVSIMPVCFDSFLLQKIMSVASILAAPNLAIVDTVATYMTTVGARMQRNTNQMSK